MSKRKITFREMPTKNPVIDKHPRYEVLRNGVPIGKLTTTDGKSHHYAPYGAQWDSTVVGKTLKEAQKFLREHFTTATGVVI